MNRPLVKAERGRRNAEVKSLSLLFIIPHSAFIIFLLSLLMLTARAVVAQEAQISKSSADAATAAGTISGRVVAEDGRPFAYATVNVYRVFSSSSGQQATMTDEAGKFSASSLQPGLYVVSAFSPGFISQPNLTEGTGETSYYRPGDTANVTLTKGCVITGTVRDANNDAVVSVPVRVMRVRDASGRAISLAAYGYAPMRMTDDRGIYRIYGLTPGTYLVSAGGSTGLPISVNAYDTDAPTYYPSATRDTAVEVTVRAGEEASGIDIRYRGDHGHVVSGTINGATSSDTGISYGISVALKHASGAFESTSFAPSTSEKPAFSIQGVSDGTYDLVAQQGGPAGNRISAPRRLTVKGADITGIELTLAPLGSIAGGVTLEPAPKKEGCSEVRPAPLIETLINARRDEKSLTETATPFSLGGASVPNDQGEFKIRNLQGGSYRLTARLPTDSSYIRSILLPGARTSNAQAKSVDAKSAAIAIGSVIILRTGENFTGANISIAQDGATAAGRLDTTREGAEAAPIPANLKIYLVPSEKARADDVLRYAEAKPASDGTFAFKNLAPGRYWIIARTVTEDDAPDRIPRPLWWDADARAKLRHDAEAANVSLELQPCQRIVDYVLKYSGAK